jgi:hypothetical protein
MTAQKSTISVIHAQGVRRGLTITSLMLLASASFLTGCGGMVDNAGTTAQAGVSLQGHVHGGQNPVSGATIQLWEAKTTGNNILTGYGSASVPLISKMVTTLADGTFNITLDYTCPASPDDMVYITATGGDPGSGVNSNLVLMAALGPCGNLNAGTYISINEVTTIASAYALSGFMKDATHVGASSTNYVGLKNAFATVNNLVDISSGDALAVTPAYKNGLAGTTPQTFNSVVPQAEIYSLANTLAACVNSNGVGGSSTNCSMLFGATTFGGVIPTDTVQAALSIAQHPGNNVGTLYTLAAPANPFPGSLGTQPNDWTIALNFIGGGLGGPAKPASKDSTSIDLAIDAAGNVWIANEDTSSISKLSPVGAPISPSTIITPALVPGGYTGGGLNIPNAIAIDTNGNAWASNNNGTLSEVTSSGVAVSSGFSGGGLAGVAPGLAIDGSNHIWVASQGVSPSLGAIVEFDSSGNVLSGTNGYQSDIDYPTGGISIDNGGNVFVTNGGNGNIVKFDKNGTFVATSGNIVDAANAYSAIDGSGNLYVPQGIPNNGEFLFTNAGLYSNVYYAPNALYDPSSVTIDGDGHVWTIDNGGGQGGLMVAPNIFEMSKTGANISPAATGYQGTGSNIIVDAAGSGIDGSGNLWLINSLHQSTVTEFIGVAAPTITPLSVAVKGAAIATRP